MHACSLRATLPAAQGDPHQISNETNTSVDTAMQAAIAAASTGAAHCVAQPASGDASIVHCGSQIAVKVPGIVVRPALNDTSGRLSAAVILLAAVHACPSEVTTCLPF